VTYTVVWEPDAIRMTSGFLSDDSDGVNQLMDAVDLLANDPRPPGAVRYGSDNLHRLHAGRYRVFYEILPAEKEIRVVHVGRVT
jgi:mRNA interferase RelE/StbE